MNNKKLYQQKMQAQLDEWQAEMDKLRARASKAGADGQIKMNKHLQSLETKAKGMRAKLSELAKTGEDAWQPLKESLDSAWDSLKAGGREAAAKFKN